MGALKGVRSCVPCVEVGNSLRYIQANQIMFPREAGASGSGENNEMTSDNRQATIQL